MPNQLIHENSPYLLQHANNPVDWYPWGEEALTKARTENKPIFLSIGYAACHWCHRMEEESFEDPETAAIMNENFVNIKVDREERPDIDGIYMQATVAMTGSGGWPMSVFLAPDLRPFYAGTYFPPVRRYNMPSFKEVLQSLAKVWREEREEVDRVGSQVLQHIQPQMLGQDKNIFSPETLEAATKSLLESYDWGYGGWGSAPKFPQPMTVEFLLRRALTDSPQREQILKAIQHVLNAMARGGMYDVVGGGFARYSVDNFWRTPHFENSIYGNFYDDCDRIADHNIYRDPICHADADAEASRPYIHIGYAWIGNLCRTGPADSLITLLAIGWFVGFVPRDRLSECD